MPEPKAIPTAPPGADVSVEVKAKPKAQGSAILSQELSIKQVAKLAQIPVDQVLAFKDRGDHLSVVTIAGQKLRLPRMEEVLDSPGANPVRIDRGAS